jgi:catechol 2,3-dioxygenase-like lactoylglutathione lyase family enzyme
MLARLARVVLMVRKGEGLAKATEFYHSGLGLQVLRATEDWAELRSSNSGNNNNNDNNDGGGVAISLQAVNTEAQVSTGYSPLLHFQVDDMDAIVAKCVQLGGHLDGPIQYPAHGKVAAMRTPDGHMIGIYEPVVSD